MVDKRTSMSGLVRRLVSGGNVVHIASAARAASTPMRMAALAVVAGLHLPAHVCAQPAAPATPTHLTIPYLGNTAPGDIEFAAAECDTSTTGNEMTCRFRQVFITRASFDATACVITSNGYDQTFRRDSDSTWVGSTEPDGACGAVDTARLEDGGGTRWTMTLTSKATRGLEREECRRVGATPPVVFSYRDIKRPLTCATIQPGSIER